MSSRATYIKWLAEKTGKTEIVKEATAAPTKEVSAQDYEYDAAEEPYVPIGIHGLMATTERLLAVNKGLADTDFRDSQYFKKHFEPDRQIWERIRTDTGNSRKKLLRMVSSRKNLSALVPFYFDDYTEKHIISNPLCTPLEEINPIHLQENQRRITGMGPGGIQSEDSITDSMNSVHPSQFGFIDPVAGPECFATNSQVYTQRGWIKWQDVLDEDLFACRVNNELEFHPASRTIREHYKGQMILAETETCRMFVTPGHRVLYKKSKEAQEQVDLASEIYGHHKLYLPILSPGAYEMPVLEAGNWSEVDYDDKVYCATVPGGLLLVKGEDNHVGYWSGNSSKAGVDVRMTWGAKMGSNGRIYQVFKNKRTGKYEWKAPHEMDGLNIKLPD